MRNRLAFFLTIAAVGTVAVPALAAPPRYDVEKLCARVAEMGGATSEMMRGSCLDQEQTAYNALKAAWEQIPAKTRTLCDRVAQAGGAGSYMMLQSCIEQENTAAQSNSGKAFHY